MVSICQTPAEHEMEMGIKSKEARKYIFNCLDDMMQVDGNFLKHQIYCLCFCTSDSVFTLDTNLANTYWGHDIAFTTKYLLDLNLCYLLFAGELVLSFGGHGHVGWEGWQARVYRPLEADAPFGCRQKDHTHKNSGSPLCHNEPPHGLSPQRSVSVWC